MILVTYKQHFKGGSKPRLDYKQFETVQAFVDWFHSQGSRLYYRLIKKNRTLSPEGWDKKRPHDIVFLQAKDDTLNMLTTIDKVVSNEGILFEDVKHCSDVIVDCIALKCGFPTGKTKEDWDRIYDEGAAKSKGI
jgi:hypothetical protein